MSQECRNFVARDNVPVVTAKTVPAGTKSNRIGRGIAVILGAATLAAWSSEASALPRDALSAWEIYAREQCRNQEERFAAIRFAPLSGHRTASNLVERHLADGKGVYMTADFNADGSPDFVLITPGYGCVSSVPAYGDRGAPVDFVVSTASGYRVFEGFVGRIGPGMIARRGDRDVLDLAGGFGGRCGAVSQVTWGWTGSGVGPLERRNDPGHLVDGEGCAAAAAPTRPRNSVAALAVGGSDARTQPPERTAGLASETTVAPDERLAIMRAAGFSKPRPDNQWRYDEEECDGVWAEIDEVVDVNADGRLDAIVKGDDDQCLGMNQRLVIILTKKKKGWTRVTDFRRRFGVFSFHPRPGIAWPDIEIFDAMSGDTKPDGSIKASGCEPFLRWNGREYVAGGTSQNGRICDLTAEGRRAPVTVGPTFGRVSFPPIEKGYYAIGVSCSEAISGGGDLLAYFDERRLAAFDGGRRLVSFESLGHNRYKVGTTSSDERGRRSRENFVIAVHGRESFTDMQYGDRYTHCASALIPLHLRQEWGDLAPR